MPRRIVVIRASASGSSDADATTASPNHAPTQPPVRCTLSQPGIHRLTRDTVRAGATVNTSGVSSRSVRVSSNMQELPTRIAANTKDVPSVASACDPTRKSVNDKAENGGDREIAQYGGNTYYRYRTGTSQRKLPPVPIAQRRMASVRFGNAVRARGRPESREFASIRATIESVLPPQIPGKEPTRKYSEQRKQG